MIVLVLKTKVNHNSLINIVSQSEDNIALYIT